MQNMAEDEFVERVDESGITAEIEAELVERELFEIALDGDAETQNGRHLGRRIEKVELGGRLKPGGDDFQRPESNRIAGAEAAGEAGGSLGKEAGVAGG